MFRGRWSFEKHVILFSLSKSKFLSDVDTGKSKKGELSIFAKSLIVLAPCLHMLPRHALVHSSDETQSKVSKIIIKLCYLHRLLQNLTVIILYRRMKDKQLKHGNLDLPEILKLMP